VAKRNVEESFHKFLDPRPEADDFQNLVILRPIPCTQISPAADSESVAERVIDWLGLPTDLVN